METGTPAPARKRLPPAVREKQILTEARRFFAEVGYGGDTRELARRLGITHPLLFRYFGTKEALIERVQDPFYMGKWRPEWDALLADRTLPMAERLKRYAWGFVTDFLDWETTRLFFFSAMRGGITGSRHFRTVAEIVVPGIATELRHHFGLPAPAARPLLDLERDLVWNIQGQLLYLSFRRFIYDQPIDARLQAIIDAEVEIFLTGAGPVLARLLA